MYDGIKIECSFSDKRKWEQSLSMIGKHAEKTGEVLSLPAEIEKNCLTFSRVPTAAGKKYFIQGSLHRFYNNGAENNNDFTIQDVRATIEHLKNVYGINPEKSKILNFEFGVNVTLPPGVEAAAFQKYLISAYSKGFEKLNPKRPAVGYIAEFNEYNIKVYDKGYQARTGELNMLRIEIKVNRTRWLDQYEFKKGHELLLSDLLNPENISILGNILIEKTRSLILTPRHLDISTLRPKERLTYYECRDARCWEEWDSKTRQRKRAQLSKIFVLLKQPDPVDVLARLVSDKWKELATLPPEKPQTKQRQKATISSIIVNGFKALLKVLRQQTFTTAKICFDYIIYQPRGQTLLIFAESTKRGHYRLIDLTIRPPPINNNSL